MKLRIHILALRGHVSSKLTCFLHHLRKWLLFEIEKARDDWWARTKARKRRGSPLTMATLPLPSSSSLPGPGAFTESRQPFDFWTHV